MWTCGLSRGAYAVDDAAMRRWFGQRVRDGHWTPVDPQGPLVMDAEDDAASNAIDTDLKP
jgi:hypothetical protein